MTRRTQGGACVQGGVWNGKGDGEGAANIGRTFTGKSKQIDAQRDGRLEDD